MIQFWQILFLFYDIWITGHLCLIWQASIIFPIYIYIYILIIQWNNTWFTTTTSQVTVTNYRNCPSCCPLYSTHISSIKALIYNVLYEVVYIWTVIFYMHLFLYLKNMSRFLALHFVIGYTPIWCKISRHWGAIQLIHSHQTTLDIYHSEKHKQCVQNVMEVHPAAKPHFYSWCCSVCFLCFVEISAVLIKRGTSTIAQVPTQTFTLWTLHSSFIILCGFS